jgi:hypothetical protein
VELAFATNTLAAGAYSYSGPAPTYTTVTVGYHIKGSVAFDVYALDAPNFELFKSLSTFSYFVSYRFTRPPFDRLAFIGRCMCLAAEFFGCVFLDIVV